MAVRYGGAYVDKRIGFRQTRTTHRGAIVLPLPGSLVRLLPTWTRVLAQQEYWVCIPLVFSFDLSFISCLAETDRGPFESPEAEAEPFGCWVKCIQDSRNRGRLLIRFDCSVKNRYEVWSREPYSRSCYKKVAVAEGSGDGQQLSRGEKLYGKSYLLSSRTCYEVYLPSNLTVLIEVRLHCP